jgi:hypothetical protein
MSQLEWRWVSQLAVSIPVFTGICELDLAIIGRTLSCEVWVVDDKCWVPQVVRWTVQVQVGWLVADNSTALLIMDLSLGSPRELFEDIRRTAEEGACCSSEVGPTDSKVTVGCEFNTLDDLGTLHDWAEFHPVIFSVVELLSLVKGVTNRGPLVRAESGELQNYIGVHTSVKAIHNQ